MNPRERILAAIRHEPVDRFPTDIWATPEVWDKLRAHFDTPDHLTLLDWIGVDGILDCAPVYRGTKVHTSGNIRHNDDTRYNEWGMGYRKQAYGNHVDGGAAGVYEEQVVFPLAGAHSISDLQSYPWPSPDEYDYSVIADNARRYPQRAIACGYTAIFYWHNQLRGLEQSLVDPLERPEFTQYLLQRLSEFFTEYHQRCFEAGRGLIDITQVTDDFGSQHGLLISPRIFDQFYRQPMQRAIDLAKSYHLSVFHHDDGDIRPLLPRLAEMGIDILNPVQWRTGKPHAGIFQHGNWNLAQIKQQFGDRFCFHGGIDNQHTLPFGAPDDVRAEVRWLAETLGKDRTGLIIAPCHNLQAITPVENILALYDEARQISL